MVILSHVLEHLVDPFDLLRRLSSGASSLLIEAPDYSHDALNNIRLVSGVPLASDADHKYQFSADSMRTLL